MLRFTRLKPAAAQAAAAVSTVSVVSGPRKRLCLSIVSDFRSDTIPSEFRENTIEKDLQARILDVAKICLNRPQLELFGGLSSGFSFGKASDADFSLHLSGYSPLLQGIEHFDSQLNKKMMRFGKALSEHGFLACRHVAARVAVVQFEDSGTNVVCDVSPGNVIGVENSKILRCIGERHPIVRCFVYAVKKWGKSYEVISSEKGCFNSYTVTSLCIMLLQELGLIPLLGKKKSGPLGELTLLDVEETLKSTPIHPALAALDPQDDEAMADALNYLLCRFSEYYSVFDFAKGTVSLTQPRMLRTVFKANIDFYMQQLKETRRQAWVSYHDEFLKGVPIDENEFSESMHMEEKRRKVLETPFCVEEVPCFINCARSVSTRKNHILDNLRNLGRMMENPELSADELFRPTAKLNVVVTDFNKSGDRRVTRFN